MDKADRTGGIAGNTSGWTRRARRDGTAPEIPRRKRDKASIDSKKESILLLNCNRYFRSKTTILRYKSFTMLESVLLLLSQNIENLESSYYVCPYVSQFFVPTRIYAFLYLDMSYYLF